MDTCYIAAPFVMRGSGSLAYDLRSLALGGEALLLRRPEEPRQITFLGTPYLYIGPYWYEEGENGVFSDCDSGVVVGRERKMIDAADVLIAFLDGSPSPGAVAELIYAVCAGKAAEIVYLRANTGESDVPSPCWYPITLAAQLSEKVRITPVDSLAQAAGLFGCAPALPGGDAAVLAESAAVKKIAAAR